MKKIIYTFLIFFFALSCKDTPTEPELSVNPFNWSTALPESQGINSEQLMRGAVEAEARGSINSIVVVRNDTLVYENYFNGYTATKPNIVRSVSKSFLSTLYGIALERREIESINKKIIDYLPEYFEQVSDERKMDITIKHLLTMTSGIGGDYENYNKFFSSKNWMQTIISAPLSFTPGTKFQYTTGGTHILSVVLAKAVRMPLDEYANKYLFDKIGIKLAKWDKDPQGNFFGGNNMYFTPRDIARFGQAMLHSGEINGEQIIPIQWAKTAIRNLRGGGSQTPWGELYNIGYGYLWWTGTLKNYSIYMALGHGGQFIVNVPELNLVVAMTSNGFVDFDTADSNEKSGLDIIANYIIEAVNK